MQWIEQRLQALEDRFRWIYRFLLDLQQQLRGAQQGVIALSQQGSDGSGNTSSPSGYYGCITSADLAAGSGGTPTSLAGQTVWQLKSGARVNLSGTYTIYNDTGSDVPSGSQAILAPNPDDTFTVVGVACTANT